MLISKSINKKNLYEITIKSLVWNSIIEVFNDEKKINIKEFLVSVQIKKKKIFVKVNKAIIKSEIQLLENKILEKIENKFKKLWFKWKDLEIVYII